MQVKVKLLKKGHKKTLAAMLLLASVQSILFAQIPTAYSEEVDINGKPIHNKVVKDIYNAYPKAIKEKNGVTIVGDDLDVKSISIKEAEKLLRKKNISLNKKHSGITILTNTKGEVVYIGRNLTPSEIEKQKQIIQKREDDLKNAESITLPYGEKTITQNTKEKKISSLARLQGEIKKTRTQKVTIKTEKSKK